MQGPDLFRVLDSSFVNRFESHGRDVDNKLSSAQLGHWAKQQTARNRMNYVGEVLQSDGLDMKTHWK